MGIPERGEYRAARKWLSTGKAGHRLWPLDNFHLAMLLTGFSYFVFPLIHGIPLLLALAFILGIGLGGAQPMIMALLSSTAPAGRCSSAGSAGRSA